MTDPVGRTVDRQISPPVRFAAEQEVVVRFIELMPVSLTDDQPGRIMTAIGG